MTPDYSTITELPGSKVVKLQFERTYSRYKFAALRCEGKDVLEVACGGGQGLGLLAEKANRVVGGDCERRNLDYAYKTYKSNNNVEVVELDAHNLTFPGNSFDIILLYEAIYYLHSPKLFLSECRRVLKDGGELIVCSANKDWVNFNPSPYSCRYFSVPELKQLLSAVGFNSQFYGAFPDRCNSFIDKVRSLIKRTVVRLNMMPKTMKGKVLLKKLFYGNMVELPSRLVDGIANYEMPVDIPCDRVDTMHTAIYVVAKK